MVSRYTGACLGLIAFAVTVIAGLWIDNPPMVTLSRAVWALVLFCALGLVVGACAQSVINEHHRRREEVEIPGADERHAMREADKETEIVTAELAALPDVAGPISQPVGTGGGEGSPVLPDAS